MARNHKRPLMTLTLVFCVVASLGSACSQPQAPSAASEANTSNTTDNASGNSGAPASEQVAAGLDPSTTKVEGESSGQTVGEIGAAATEEEGAEVPEAFDDEDGLPRELDFPEKNKVPAKAKLSTQCVDRGGRVHLSVESPAEAAVAYQTVYSDDQAGSPPPYGAGYGGNDGGEANKLGHYESFWIVSATAPPGRARVDVIVGHDNKWGYTSVRFAVADSDGSCPEGWADGRG